MQGLNFGGPEEVDDITDEEYLEWERKQEEAAEDCRRDEDFVGLYDYGVRLMKVQQLDVMNDSCFKDYS